MTSPLNTSHSSPVKVVGYRLEVVVNRQIVVTLDFSNDTICVVNLVTLQSTVSRVRVKRKKAVVYSSNQKSSSINSKVTMKPSKDGSDVNGSEDPCTFLYSDSDNDVDTVRVDDKGSKPQYVSVQVQGIPTSGIIDNGEDITIVGG